MLGIKVQAFLIGAGCFTLVFLTILFTPLGQKLEAISTQRATQGSTTQAKLTIPETGVSGTTPSSEDNTIVAEETSEKAVAVATKSRKATPKNVVNTNVTGSKPIVSIYTSNGTLPESAGTIEVRAQLSKSPASEIRVPYTISGTATANQDHDLADGYFVFSPNIIEAVITFKLIDDTSVETDEILTITLGSASTVMLGDRDSYQLTILDNDQKVEPPCSRLDEDNATWINAGIKAAIAQGKTEYYIPACTYRVDSTIVVPAGTKNFKLYGAGSEKTIFVTPMVRFSSQIIQTGVTVMYHNDWGLWNRTNWAIENVNEGATTLTLKDGQANWNNGQRYIVWSRQSVCHIDYPDTCNHYASEIVTVTGYDSSTKTVSIEQGLGRSFTSVDSNGTLEPVRLASFDGLLSENIEIADLGFDGLLTDASSSSYGLLQASTTLGLKVHGLRAKNFSGWAVNISLDKNVKMWDVDVSDATQTGAGAGYGITIQKSRFVEVWNSVANNNRHSFVVHSGSMDVDFHDITFNSGFDTHGYDSKRITLRNCGVGADSFNIGNGAWTLGDEVSISNCQLTGGGFFGYGLKNLQVDNVVFGARIQLLNPTETPSLGAFTFRNTTFASDWTAILFTGNGRYEKASFIDCTFRQPKGNAAWSILSLRPLYTTESIPGNFEFIRMKMIADNSSGHMTVGSRTSDFNLTITDSVFSGPKDMKSIAIGFESYAQGVATLTNNTLYSTATSFFTNSGPTTVTSTNNQILPPQ